MKLWNPCGLMNFVPPEVIEAHKNLKRKNLLRKILFAALAVLIIAIGAEAAFMGYNYTNGERQVSVSLQEKVNKAQTSISEVKKIQAVLNKAEQEHKPLIKIIDALAAIKPAEVKITKIDIAESGAIQIEGYVNDPALCNSYVERINNKKELFASAQLEKLNANPSLEHKNFVIKTSIMK